MLRHIRVASKQESKDRILAAIDAINRDPVVHTWTYRRAASLWTQPDKLAILKKSLTQCPHALVRRFRGSTHIMPPHCLSKPFDQGVGVVAFVADQSAASHAVEQGPARTS